MIHCFRKRGLRIPQECVPLGTDYNGIRCSFVQQANKRDLALISIVKTIPKLKAYNFELCSLILNEHNGDSTKGVSWISYTPEFSYQATTNSSQNIAFNILKQCIQYGKSAKFY